MSLDTIACNSNNGDVIVIFHRFVYQCKISGTIGVFNCNAFIKFVLTCKLLIQLLLNPPDQVTILVTSLNMIDKIVFF